MKYCETGNLNIPLEISTDLDDCKDLFLIRAAMVVKGRTVTLYQEVHSNNKPNSVQY